MTCYAGLPRARLPDSLVGALRPSCVLYLLAAKDVMCRRDSPVMPRHPTPRYRFLDNLLVAVIRTLSAFHRNETFSHLGILLSGLAVMYHVDSTCCTRSTQPLPNCRYRVSGMKRQCRQNQHIRLGFGPDRLGTYPGETHVSAVRYVRVDLVFQDGTSRLAEIHLSSTTISPASYN